MFSVARALIHSDNSSVLSYRLVSSYEICEVIL